MPEWIYKRTPKRQTTPRFAVHHFPFARLSARPDKGFASWRRSPTSRWETSTYYFRKETEGRLLREFIVEGGRSYPGVFAPSTEGALFGDRVATTTKIVSD